MGSGSLPMILDMIPDHKYISKYHQFTIAPPKKVSEIILVQKEKTSIGGTDLKPLFGVDLKKGLTWFTKYKRFDKKNRV